MRLSSPDKIAFVLSVAVFAFLYGIATQAFGWFPSDLVRRAWNQAEAVSPLSTSALTGQDSDREHWLVPRVYDRTGARSIKANEIQPGLTLIAGMWADSGLAPGLKLIDEQGATVHQWPIDTEDLFSDPPEARTRRDPPSSNIHGTYLYPNGDILFNVEYIGTVRMDACGRAEWTLAAGNHHSISRADDGSFWVPGGKWIESREGSARRDSFPSLGSSIYRDRIINISESGQILSEIDVLKLLYENNLLRYIAKGSYFTAQQDSVSGDITHINDVNPLESSLADEYPLFDAGDLAVSLHHLDLVFVFDPESREIKWHASEPFIQQHDPDFIGDGWIGVFDNNRDGTERGVLAGGSRIVAIQPHTDSTQVLFPTSKSDPFYTDVQGKWQRLTNGNVLLIEARAGRIAEVTADGDPVWEWVVPPARDTLIPEVTGGTRYDLTVEQVASWPCSPDDSTDDRQEATS